MGAFPTCTAPSKASKDEDFLTPGFSSLVAFVDSDGGLRAIVVGGSLGIFVMVSVLVVDSFGGDLTGSGGEVFSSMTGF